VLTRGKHVEISKNNFYTKSCGLSNLAAVWYDQKMVDIEKIKPNLKNLAEKYGLSLVLLFGSRVTGKTHSKSDTDMAYFSDKPLSLSQESSFFIDLLPVVREKNIDIVSLKKASPLLLKEIFDNAIVLYEARESLFSELRIYAYRKYFDSKKLFDIRSGYIRGIINNYKKELKYV